MLAASVLAACTSSGSPTTSTTPTGSSSGPIIIGASLSLTGDFSADGQAFYKGYELWASDVNKSGGILGRKVTLKILNDDSLPNQVVTNYQTLFGADHVDVAFGPFSSAIGRLTSNTLWSAWLDGVSKTEGAPPAPSTNAMPKRAATDDAGAVSSDENGPKATSTWSAPNSVW